MISLKKNLPKYWIERAKDTFDDAKILADKGKWNSAINRLYYAAYYAITAMLLNAGLKAATHHGAKSLFSEHFIKKGILPKKYGKIYSQLFTWRQKGDYDDFFEFEKDNVLRYFGPVDQLITIIEKEIYSPSGTD